MSDDEQMIVIGRMVTQRKALQQKGIALESEIERASKAFQSLSGLLANYQSKHHYSTPLEITSEIAEFMDSKRLESLVSELIQTRQALGDVQARLDQI